LQKPVDPNVLSETLRRAKQKMRRSSDRTQKPDEQR